MKPKIIRPMNGRYRCILLLLSISFLLGVIYTLKQVRFDCQIIFYIYRSEYNNIKRYSYFDELG